MDAPVYHLERVVKAKSEMKDFDGPLDLILYLLGQNKMEIQDIQISLILEQYLDWMEQRKQMDLEVASEFIAMASQLAYIKTRMLLSIHDEETASEMDELISALEAHQRSEYYAKIKAATGELQHRYQLGQDYFTKPPEPLPTRTRTYEYVHQPSELAAAMSELLRRTKDKLPPPIQAFDGIVGRETYSVTEKSREILAWLVRSGVTRLSRLFRRSRSRSEVVATFLAILELCRERRIRLAGTDGDFTVTGIFPGRQPVSGKGEPS